MALPMSLECFLATHFATLGLAAVLGLVGVLLVCTDRHARRSSRPTYSLHPWCPPLISGIYAAYRIGVDDTAFLLHLHRTYGSVVYMPAPLRAHWALSPSLIKALYEGSYAKALTFPPAWKEMATVLFDLDRSYTQHLETEIFPLHNRYLAPKVRTVLPMQRYQAELLRLLDNEERKRVASAMSAVQSDKHDKLSRQRQSIQVNLVDWAFRLMFCGSIHALYGPSLEQFAPMDDWIRHSCAFDNAFPLLASQLLPNALQPYIALGGISHAITSREWLLHQLGAWAIITQCDGLADDDLAKQMTDLCHTKLKYPERQMGAMLLGGFWALTANTPFAICWILIILIQADDSLMEELLCEIDSLDITNRDSTAAKISKADLPLLTSVIYETLRLRGTPSSIRQCISGRPVIISDPQTGFTTVVSHGEQLVCWPRVGFLDEKAWGKSPQEWDGRRFTGDGVRLLPDLRVFGGGTSKVPLILPRF